jgi:hypothetical protein
MACTNEHCDSQDNCSCDPCECSPTVQCGCTEYSTVAERDSENGPLPPYQILR